MGIFIGRGATQQYNNGRRLSCHAPTHMQCLGNCVHGTEFLKADGIVSVTKAEFRRHDGRAEMGVCTLDLPMFIEYIFNPIHFWIRMARRLIEDAG
jgi:hypothetical protein